MKNLVILLALAVSTFGLRAQVTVEVLTDENQYLAKETLPVTVKIYNHSGQTLHLGQDTDWLLFNVESRDGLVVPQTGHAPVVGEFDLESGKVATKKVDVAPYFGLDKTGAYRVSASVRIPNWKTSENSNEKKFEIVRGSKIWDQSFGVPLPPGVTDQAPEVRKYALLQAIYTRKMKLYFRLSDNTETTVYKVFPIGQWVSFSRLDTQLDKDNHVHILYQYSARLYSYTEITPQGEIAARRVYDYTDTRPRLKMDNTGHVSIIGGARHPMDEDVPPAPQQVSSQ